MIALGAGEVEAAAAAGGRGAIDGNGSGGRGEYGESAMAKEWGSAIGA